MVRVDGWPGGQGGRVAGWSGYGRVTGGQGKVAGFDSVKVDLFYSSTYWLIHIFHFM